MKKSSILDTMVKISQMKNSAEILKRINYASSQTKVELIESWCHNPNDDNLKRSIDDLKDMLYQNDLSVKPVWAIDQCHEYPPLTT